MTFASRTQFHVERQWGLKSVLNVKAVVATFNQEKALVGAFSVITNLRIAFVWITSEWWGAGGEAETSTPAADHTQLQQPLQHCRHSARTIGTDVYWISLVMFVVLGLSTSTNKYLFQRWEKMLIWQYFQRPQLFWLFLCIRIDWLIGGIVYLSAQTST